MAARQTVEYYSYSENADILEADFPCKDRLCVYGYRRFFDKRGEIFLGCYCFTHEFCAEAESYLIRRFLHKKRRLEATPEGRSWSAKFINPNWFGRRFVLESRLIKCLKCELKFETRAKRRLHDKEAHLLSCR